MTKAQSVIEFYVLCNQLKNVIRTGWTVWGVKSDRLESVAEHVYGTQMLAISMWSQYGYDIDVKKVLSMLAVHEIEETVIGDLTQFQIGRAEKEEMGHKAVEQILASLMQGDQIKALIYEFDKQESTEAKFAFQCDKLECDIQSKLYDEQRCVSLNKQENNPVMQNGLVKSLLDNGMSWGEMWLRFSQKKYPYDSNFLEVSNYALNNNISSSKEEEMGV